ncbi:MAG: sel1 repeat family protein, partial [Nitrospinae bacterium]|nr:sel1 repeat family protein [Nitrospinota bacterium]
SMKPLHLLVLLLITGLSAPMPGFAGPKKTPPKPNLSKQTALPKTNPSKQAATLQTNYPNEDGLKGLIERANKGAAIAQSLLGDVYAFGREGVAQDYAEAVKWYRKSADQGFAPSQCKLGDMSLIGQGVPQDFAEAVKWYRKSADQGDANAMGSLALMYTNGHGVQKDYVEASKWLNLASAFSDKDNREGNVSMLEELAAEMTPAQIAEAQKRARDWKPKW